jgi:hypothetical protein
MQAMRTAFAAAVMLSACAGGDSVGNGGASPFGSAGGPGSSAEEERDDTTGGDESTSEVPTTSAPMTGAEADAESGVDTTDDGAPQDPPPDDPGPAGDCCTPGPAGCANDPMVEACVCQIDDYCCTIEWDDECVWMVGECAPACPGAVPPDQGDGSEGGFEDTGFAEDGGGFGDCCAPTGVPGCGDPFIAACVCFQDNYCCEVEWDDVCVELAYDCGC